MAKKEMNLRDEIRNYKFEFDLLQKIPCTKQENKEYERILKNGGELPDGIYAYTYDSGEVSTTDFYTIYESDLSEAEIREYLTYKQLSFMKTIKNCVLFFTILAIVSMVISFIVLMSAL